MPLLIRRATNSDVPDIVRVVKAVYDEYGFTWDETDYHADLYDVERHYDAAGNAFFAAQSDGTVVGTAALSQFPTIPGRPGEPTEQEGTLRVGACDCSLDRLYVDPNARRMGIGRALLDKVIDEARERGCKQMEMWSDKRFVDAHRLYQKLGAKVVGDRICHDPDQSPEWGLHLPLRSDS